MSWNIRVTNVKLADLGVELAKATLHGGGPPGSEERVAAQVALAIKQAVEMASSPAMTSDPNAEFHVSLSGHANPADTPPAGWAGNMMTVSVSIADPKPPEPRHEHEHFRPKGHGVRPGLGED